MRKSSVLFTFCCSSIIPYTDTILVADAGSLVCLCVKLSMPSTCHIIVYRKKNISIYQNIYKYTHFTYNSSKYTKIRLGL